MNLGLSKEAQQRVKLLAAWSASALLLSFLALTFLPGALYPIASGFLWSAIVIAVLAWSWSHPERALAALVIELLVGSKGGLVRLLGDDHGNGGIPLRMGLFGVTLLVWLISLYKHAAKERAEFLLTWLKQHVEYVVLGVCVVVAFAHGLVTRNAFTLSDANAWGFWLMLPVAIDLARRDREKVWSWVQSGLMAGTSLLTLLTFLAFRVESYHEGSAAAQAVFAWLRVTGLAEPTRVAAGVWRVFFQSHLYAACAFALVPWLATRRLRLLIGTFASLTLMISFSRSLLVGAAFGLLASAGMFVFRQRQQAASAARWREPLKRTGEVALALLMAVGIYALSLVAPGKFTTNLLSASTSRLSFSESAVVSRWELKPVLERAIMESPFFGKGFGATVTYTSADPRVIAATGGAYTTYAFEWGWHDLALKMGLIGVLAFLAVISRLCIRLFRLGTVYATMFLSSLVVLVATHVFTPYIAHPLGIALLIAMESYLTSYDY